MVSGSQKEILTNNTSEPTPSLEQRPLIIRRDPVSRALAGAALAITFITLVVGVDIYNRLQKDLERIRLEHKLETTLLLGEICGYEETMQQINNSPDYNGTKERCVQYQTDWIQTIKKQELPHP